MHQYTMANSLDVTTFLVPNNVNTYVDSDVVVVVVVSDCSKVHVHLSSLFKL